MSDYEERVIENLRAELAAARIELARVSSLAGVWHTENQRLETELARLRETAAGLYVMARHCPCGELPADFDFVTPLEQGEAIFLAQQEGEDG